MSSLLEAIVRLHGSALPKDVVVLSFSSQEAFSTPYRVVVEFSTADGSFDVDAVLRSRCLLELPDPSGTPSYLDGQVAEAHFLRVVGGMLHFEVTLRPAVFWLAFRENSRIFQEKTIPEILQKLIDEAGYSTTSDFSQLTKSYPKRTYTVQYRESTLNFIQRLCEDVGIFYYFVHSKDGHRLVFADDIEKLTGLPAALSLSLGEDAPLGTLPLASLVRRERLRTSAVTMRDFDLNNPPVFPESTAPAEGPLPQQVFLYPGGFVLPDDGKLRARAELLQRRHDVEFFEGAMDTSGPLLGRVAESSGAAEPDLNQKLRFVEIIREGFQHDSEDKVHAVHVSFRGVRADTPYLPPRRARRPRIHGLVTAVVVGDANADQSILVDPVGRIKVRFHWDRLSAADQNASCWIRVSQVSLGGSMILPRVGWEVAVAFLEGDPDQPVVVGKIYNAENMPPMSLPDAKASGSFSSKSSPGGGGSNELTMGDSGGSQGFAIKAQKDLNFSTGFDQTEAIQVDDESQVNLNLSRSVKVDDTAAITGNQEVTIGAHQSCKVKGNQEVSVGGNETANSTANFLEKVTGARKVTIAGNQLMLSNGERMNIKGAVERTVGALELMCTASSFSQNIGSAASSSVGAIRVHLTGGEHGEVVTGAKSVTIAGAAAYIVKGSRSATCEGAVAHLVGGIVQRKIKGSYTIKGPMITIVGGTGKFKGGSSQLSMNGGPITMKGGTITIKAAIIKKTAGSIKLG